MSTYNPKNEAHHEVLRTLLGEAREAKGWFQAELAERLRKPQSFVSKVESGERKLNWIEVLFLLEVLQISEVEFLKEFRRRVEASNERTQTALLQDVAEREAKQAKAQVEIERLMRENNISAADLRNPATKVRKAKK